jgi:hypothetical protein
MAASVGRNGTLQLQVQMHETIAYRLQEHLSRSIPGLRAPASARQWTEEDTDMDFVQQPERSL